MGGLRATRGRSAVGTRSTHTRTSVRRPEGRREGWAASDSREECPTRPVRPCGRSVSRGSPSSGIPLSVPHGVVRPLRLRRSRPPAPAGCALACRYEYAISGIPLPASGSPQPPSLPHTHTIHADCHVYEHRCRARKVRQAPARHGGNSFAIGTTRECRREDGCSGTKLRTRERDGEFHRRYAQLRPQRVSSRAHTRMHLARARRRCGPFAAADSLHL